MLEVSIRDELVQIRRLLDEMVHLMSRLATPDERSAANHPESPANRSPLGGIDLHNRAAGDTRLMCKAV